MIINYIETPIKYSKSGTIGFSLKEICNFDFNNLQLVIERKDERKYIKINRKNLKYDFNERFRKNLPEESLKIKDYNDLIKSIKLGYINRNGTIIRKNNFDRNSTNNISLFFYLSNIKKHNVKIEWYNKNGFYKEEINTNKTQRSFTFSLKKDDIEENVGVWSALVYLDNNFIIHKTFLVY